MCFLTSDLTTCLVGFFLDFTARAQKYLIVHPCAKEEMASFNLEVPIWLFGIAGRGVPQILLEKEANTNDFPLTPLASSPKTKFCGLSWSLA